MHPDSRNKAHDVTDMMYPGMVKNTKTSVS